MLVASRRVRKTGKKGDGGVSQPDADRVDLDVALVAALDFQGAFGS